MAIAGLPKRAVRSVIRRALGIGPIRRVVERELGVSRASSAGGPAPATLPRFTDQFGVEHELDGGLRDRLKPNWRTMCDPATASAPPSDEVLRGRLRKAAKSVAEVDRLLTLTTGSGISGRVLEVGCYDGSAAFELSRRPGTTVTASDMARYYVVQRPGVPAEAAVVEEEGNLARLRERVRRLADRPQGSVTFVEDDVTASALEPGSFDLIVSFEVLEHLRRPADAFAAMAALLAPGGVLYHDYNPFFSSIGGHSLATLDLPWGHARLTPEDVARYLHEVRPDEADQGLRFYTESLNRMTLRGLDEALDGAGLEVLAKIPWNQRSLVAEADPGILREVRRSYPTATFEDLLATFVIVIARRRE